MLLDDVLLHQALRAVLNELFDMGVPPVAALAVLVDRGGRELPVQTDYAAARGAGRRNSCHWCAAPMGFSTLM